ncbi:DUF5134 domain-containing protein [Streptacidiphilus sp. PB12-B1b]|uniref:DUF5134 domain-containing protein n=1 Tax=Streptacidiphilus sp. PB12-B1b TaxID=2705012 RepID=UPI0015FAD23D|nr:DUF5134 domain-containing protein [Streptacidiphilus sp. PB12-B1b]QMU77866.1 DUF5134 domain-containing protein [Streptacidiphilus sp. PB12-B1b]
MTGMTGGGAAGWLIGTVAAAMLATALYCAGRLVAARLWRRPSARDVDVGHALMGVAMAGMLVPGLDPLAAPLWAAVFAAATAWFALRAAAELHPRPTLSATTGGGAASASGNRWPERGTSARHGRGRAWGGWSGSGASCGAGGGGSTSRVGVGAHVPHLVLTGTMLYMYLALPGAPAAGAAAAGPRWPLLALLLGLALVGCAVAVLARALAPRARAAGGFLAPRAADGCDLGMCLAMVYLLFAMV